MNNIKDMLSLLHPITEAIVAVAGLLAVVIQFIDRIRELWARLKPAMKQLILLATQLLPIGMVLWYYMYWAVQYHSRFTDRAIFLLLVAEPTVLIIAYEMFWGIWLYPKLLSIVKQKVNARQSSHTNPNKDNEQKPGVKSSSNKKHQ